MWRNPAAWCAWRVWGARTGSLPYTRVSKQQRKEPPIRIKTLLNEVHLIKGFVYTHCTLEELDDARRLVVNVRPRANGRPRCSGCGHRGARYGAMPGPRLLLFVPLWGMAVLLRDTMRRVDCRRCGVTVESVPWAEGKNTCTHAMRLFLASWARRLS